jgi:hypothetical protein
MWKLPWRTMHEEFSARHEVSLARRRRMGADPFLDREDAEFSLLGKPNHFNEEAGI